MVVIEAIQLEPKGPLVMDVKEAIALAKGYVSDIFSGESISGLGLEEVEYDDYDNQWKITIGFNRSNIMPKTVIENVTGNAVARRDYKVITIKDQDGKVVSMKNRLRSDA
jgi:hypothetical protein